MKKSFFTEEDLKKISISDSKMKQILGGNISQESIYDEQQPIYSKSTFAKIEVPKGV